MCELTWQLRGQATGRQVEGATVGVTVNQGLFGHGSSVIVTRSPNTGLDAVAVGIRPVMRRERQNRTRSEHQSN